MNLSELEQKLMEAFKAESAERLESLFTRLAALEHAENRDEEQKLLEIVFREAHSLKGAARSVNIGPVEHLCQAMENVFGALKQKKLDFSPKAFDLLNHAVQLVEKFLATDAGKRTEIEQEMANTARLLDNIRDTKDLSDRPIISKKEADGDEELKSAEKQGAENPEEEPECICEETASPSARKEAGRGKAESCVVASESLFTGFVRVPAKKLDSLLLKAEELIFLKQIAYRYLSSARELAEALTLPRRFSDMKDELDLLKKVSEQTGNYARIIDYIDYISALRENCVTELSELIQAMEQGNREMESMIDDLIDDTKTLTLLPFSTLFAIFPRMVREISRDLGKSARLNITGGEIEIDKRILEQIKDPMIHLLRNAVDHGIEPPEIRKERKKPETGTINVSVSQAENNSVEVIIEDDGAGIDTEALVAKAVKAGIVDANDADMISDEAALSLIFHSGLSTSSIITEISGRGLGMAIVRENIEKLGGKINIQNFPGRGTRFSIHLPVTKATFRGILVRTCGQHLILPNANVERILRIRRNNLKTIENQPVAMIEGQAIAIADLGRILGLPPSTEHDDSVAQPVLTAVLIFHGDRRLALISDEIICEMEILVKNLGRQIRRIPYVSGVTVLGTGEVVPVLNIADIIKSASSGPGLRPSEPEVESEPDEKKSILVVEDSFTARTLLKNILEASGYRVTTAADGEEGYAHLKSGDFDAVVSDVEMPKMDGFELTRKIRADEALADKPVILVTTLESREDRKKGMEAGADAYIVKSSFDQSNLLDIIGRLA